MSFLPTRRAPAWGLPPPPARGSWPADAEGDRGNLQAWVEAWNGDDFDAWIALIDPEIEWFALMEVFRGHASARQLWESFKASAQLRVRFDDIRDLGESVLALGGMEATDLQPN